MHTDGRGTICTSSSVCIGVHRWRPLPARDGREWSLLFRGGRGGGRGGFFFDRFLGGFLYGPLGGRSLAGGGEERSDFFVGAVDVQGGGVGADPGFAVPV